MKTEQKENKHSLGQRLLKNLKLYFRLSHPNFFLARYI